MAKDRAGQIKPHNLGGSRFKDGSLREDIPLGSLHTQFNCNFSIVSQTNPHIHLFFFAPRGSVGMSLQLVGCLANEKADLLLTAKAKVSFSSFVLE